MAEEAAERLDHPNIVRTFVCHGSVSNHTSSFFVCVSSGDTITQMSLSVARLYIVFFYVCVSRRDTITQLSLYLSLALPFSAVHISTLLTGHRASAVINRTKLHT